MANTDRIETDGCSEMSCIYHGEENRRKADERAQAQAEAEQEHWEQEPAYWALYFPPVFDDFC